MEAQMSQFKILSRNGLKHLGIDYCNVHLLRLEAEGKFPKRFYLSPARVAWVESEILEYLARCVAARA
jgi:predicted DNA-binding transcriptional regulator AlpA